ncbi:MAG: adenylosuccinate synthase [Acidobacteria bacterium]|nr:adenylosuccinate synthase [Acidobacteriota bacterium]
MQTRNLAVLGAQWGDEGKGKIVDLLCDDFDIVARFQGGHNAGHTVKFGAEHYSLHLIPSGILHPGKTCVLGNGMVIDPVALLAEVAKLRDQGVVIEDNLRISSAAHCILPIHAALDQARETAAGEEQIGTTRRGIGPAYESKMSRHGVQMADLLDEKTLRKKVESLYEEKNALLTRLYRADPVDPEETIRRYTELGETIGPWITDTVALLREAMERGGRIMFEGAQGALLDVDHGTYPFVTSSSCCAGGIATGLGVPPSSITEVLGVVKAYTTRVGSGPFPTELSDRTGEYLRSRGNEFGTTTGRPRRTGWLDLDIVRKSVYLSGMTALAVTKLDVLDELERIEVAIGRDPSGELSWKTVDGWQTPTVSLKRFDDLPEQARDYIRLIEDTCGCPVSIVSTGPRREETILR